MSVICLSYNHEPYVREALESVIGQTYPNIEIIVIDDGSKDKTQDAIRAVITPFPHIRFIPLEKNMGNCWAFNYAFGMCEGKYIIDFALDDVMLPERIEEQVKVFESLDLHYGVVFSDVVFIDEHSREVGQHYQRGKDGQLIEPVKDGDVYKLLLERYYISPPSMMVRRSVLEEMAGYDETLAYEDFDFWVRSSRTYQYYFIDKVQTLKRVLHNSHGSKFAKKNQSAMLDSTLKVCEKAFLLNKTEEEHQALAKRIRYHMRQALFTEHFSSVEGFALLLRKVDEFNVKDRLVCVLSNLKIRLHWIYRTWR